MGTYIYGTSNIAISSNGGNTFKSISVSIKDSTLTPNINTSNPLKFYIAGASAEKEYTIIINVTDQVATNTITTKIPSSNFVLHVKTGGKSIGIGSAAGENGTIKLGWKLLVNNGIEINSSSVKLSSPLSVSNGGTGVNSYDGLKQQLGINNLNYLSLSGGTISGDLSINGALSTTNSNKAITLKGNSFTYNNKNVVLDIIEEMCEEDRLILDILKREYILDNEEALEKFENKYGFDTIQSDAKDTLEVFFDWVRRGFWEGNTTYIQFLIMGLSLSYLDST